MARRHSMSKEVRAFAAGVAIAVLFTWHSGPAIAASNTPATGDDIAKSANELGALSPTHYLTPRIEAALRKVFEESQSPLANDDTPAETQRPAMNTRVPGLSDEQLARYKRQMYRRDI